MRQSRVVGHDGINRGEGSPADTLIVVVFGRVGGERGGAKRNPGADCGYGVLKSPCASNQNVARRAGVRPLRVPTAVLQLPPSTSGK